MRSPDILKRLILTGVILGISTPEASESVIPRRISRVSVITSGCEHADKFDLAAANTDLETAGRIFRSPERLKESKELIIDGKRGTFIVATGAAMEGNIMIGTGVAHAPVGKDLVIEIDCAPLEMGEWELPIGPGEKPVYVPNLGDYVQTTRKGWVEVPPGYAPFTRFCFTDCFSDVTPIWPFSR